MDITVEELHQKICNAEALVLIDVREPYEYEEYNIGAKLIPLGNIISEIENITPDKNGEVIVHCRSGARSAMAKSLLTANGFTNVRNLLGGILEWQSKYGN